MALPNIKLDERTFQDLVDEAKLRITHYCPEWTNHNVSDPGVTLIELFAHMVDQMLYQMNRVPEKNYRTFLDMIGVRLAPPNAARVDVTFRLAAPQPQAVIIPRATEVATVRTENQAARVFTTEEDLTISPPDLRYILTSPNGQTFIDHSSRVFDRSPREVQVFQDEPQPGNAVYLGFTGKIAGNTLLLSLDCEKLGVGINPYDPPLVWEYWDEPRSEWMALEVARDTTEGLVVPYSEVEAYMPVTAGQLEIRPAGLSDDVLLAYWIRARYSELVRGQPGYVKSPMIRQFRAFGMGGTVSATHSQLIRMEELGRSNGEPGQSFRLLHTPILALDAAQRETLLVITTESEVPQVWKQVPDFSDSGPQDHHFVCDNVSGQIIFGPSIRTPQGEERQHGTVPPYGARIVMAAYRTGGGTEGNVGSNTITILKTSIPFVDSVFNRRPATGGTSAETLEHALNRGPKTLRARNRAVTAEDFEALTREATSGVARVRCLTPTAIDRPSLDPSERVEPGTVTLLVVPEVDANLREVRPEHLNLSAAMRSSITTYLDERRLVTTKVDLNIPKYQWVTVQARVRTLNSFVNERVKREAERRLYRFIRPVQGGPDPMLRFEDPGEGWPFGRVLYISELYPILQTIDGVEFVERIELYPVNDLARGQAGEPAQTVDPGPRGLLCSYRHQVVLI